jgi:hypothetical protein
VWTDILQRAFGNIQQIDVDRIQRLSRATFRNRYTPVMLLLPQSKSLLGAATLEYVAALEKIYQAIQESTGSDVIVDSSKVPAHAFILSLIPTIDLYLVHLIRDSRAVSFSWQRQTLRADDPGTPMERMGAAASSMKWNVWNITIGLFHRTLRERYIRVRYEDFVAAPQKTVHRILHLVNQDATPTPFVTDHSVDLKATHTVWGNPSRTRTGIVELRPDVEWKQSMIRWDRIAATALSWPLLLWYGYFSRDLEA